MKCGRLTFTFFLILLVFSKINGQPSTFDSTQSAALNYAKEYFRDKVAEDAHLYIGKDYTHYKKSSLTGHPFFVSGQMQNSEVYYDGALYDNVPLLFDIVNQEILINRYNQNVSMKLLNEKIKYFILNNHRFEKVSQTDKEGNVTTGIYDVVFNGKASVLVKRAKRIHATSNLNEPSAFVEIDEFFIRKGNSFYNIDKKSSIMHTLSDKKELMKAFIRKNKFRFKKNIEEEMIATAAYYETLNK